jgi:hypothetical protein
MTIDELTQNADRVVSRLEAQINEFGDRNRLKYDHVTYAIFEARVDQLRALGLYSTRVEKLTIRLAEIRVELAA